MTTERRKATLFINPNRARLTAAAIAMGMAVTIIPTSQRNEDGSADRGYIVRVEDQNGARYL